MNRKMSVNYHVTNVGRKIDINDLINTSDYHFIMCFKHNKEKKEITIEIFDPQIDKNFKIACIDKAIDFLQLLRSKIADDPERERREMMNRKGVTSGDFKPISIVNEKPPVTMNDFLAKIPPINDEMNFVMKTFDEYFKGIEIDKKMLAGDNAMILRITSNNVNAKSAFNKFKFEFWDKYYHKVLKSKLGDFTITFQFSD